MPERTDQEWVRQLKQEDRQAREDLWQLLFTYGTLLARPYGIEDLGKDAAVEAYRRIMTRGVFQFSFKGQFLGFCKAIISNEVNRLLRRLINEEKHLTDRELDEDDALDEDPAEQSDPLKVDAALILSQIQPCLDQLGVRDRDVLQLRYFQGLTPEVVATQVGLTRNYVNLIVHRACLKLRDCLQRRGYQDVEDIGCNCKQVRRS